MVHEEAIPVMNFYAPNNIVSKIYEAKNRNIKRNL